MKTITLKTPPISVNNLYKGRKFLTTEGKVTKEALEWEIKSQWKEPLREDNIAVNIVFYIKNDRSDLDNLLKGFLDSMTGTIWKDDKQITEIHVFKQIDKKDPRTEISII